MIESSAKRFHGRPPLIAHLFANRQHRISVWPLFQQHEPLFSFRKIKRQIEHIDDNEGFSGEQNFLNILLPSLNLLALLPRLLLAGSNIFSSSTSFSLSFPRNSIEKLVLFCQPIHHIFLLCFRLSADKFELINVSSENCCLPNFCSK